MTPNTSDISPVNYARIAGMLYLIIAVFGGFGIGYVPYVIAALPDAAATVDNLLAHQGLFRMGIIADVVVILSEVALTAMLYIMFKPYSPTLSLIAAYARLSMTIVMGGNLLVNVSVGVVITTFPPEMSQNIVLALLKVHASGIYIWQLFFSLHLIVLGYLVIKSDRFPRVLGWLMAIGSFGYLVEGLAKSISFENGTLSIAIIGLLIIVAIGEISFALWLLIKGANPQQE